MTRSKSIIGIVMIILSVAALITWEKWGKDRFLYEEILVLEKNVEKGTVISEEMLSSKRTDSTEKDCLTVDDSKALVGREAAFFLHKGVPLFEEYFQTGELSADGEEGRYILSIPEDWLNSFPASIERGNRAFFFHGGKFVTSAMVAAVGGEPVSLEIIVTDEQASVLSEIAGRGEPMTVIYY